MRSYFLVATFALALVAAGTATATPVTYTITGNSISANVSGTFNFSIDTNLGTFNGTGSAAGALAASPTGSGIVEWGVPAGGPSSSDPTGGWFNQLTANANDLTITAPNPGTATGLATVDLSVIDIDFDLAVGVDFIDIELISNFAGATLGAGQGPGFAGPGPWTALDTVNLGISAQVDIAASGPLGININQNDVAVAQTPVNNLPFILNLERTGPGTRGTGSQITATLPGLTLSLGAQAPGTFQVDASLGGVISIDFVTITLTSLDFTDVTGTIVGTSNAIIPEPATMAMIGIGLVGLGIIGRRSS